MGDKNRIIKFHPKMSYFLLGVRGSGKTWLLTRQLRFPPNLYINLLNQSVYQSYLLNISRFYEQISQFKKPEALIVVDEIQKMPELLNEVHRLIEESSRGEAPPRRFILTGSSARKLRAPGVNLLAGRAVLKHLHPFLPEELGKDFNLDHALRYGLLPKIWNSYDKEDSLKAYTELYLKEEIKAEALARDLSGFARFLEAVALCHGQAVNMSSIARDCGVKQYLVQDFFSILEDTMMGFFLPAYTPKLRMREQKNKKFYLIDPGIARALKHNFGPVSLEEKGFLFEGLVIQILRAYKDYKGLYDKIFYWAPAEAKKTEVDFLLQKGKEFIAIEVKAKSEVSAQDYKGLKAIGELAQVKKRIVVHLGLGKLPRKTKEGIEIWPFDFFCQNLKEGNNFDSDFNYSKFNLNGSCL